MDNLTVLYVFAGVFSYFFVGAIFAGIMARITGSYLFPPNLFFWPLALLVCLVILAYCVASGNNFSETVRDL